MSKKYFGVAAAVAALTFFATIACAQYDQPVQSPPPMLGLIVGPALAFFALAGIALYVYTALAYMTIAKKLGIKNPWLAWIPVANIYLLAKTAGMPAWPMWFLIGCLIPILNFIFIIVLMVFIVMWNWKTFEKVGRPGWWVLLNFIPFVGQIVFLILLGVVAWGKK